MKNPHSECDHDDPNEHPKCDHCWWNQTHDEDGNPEWPGDQS